jgi:hypothetical protein
MNVRLQYSLEFLAGIYFEDQLQMNSYEINLSLLTKTTDSASTNIAMDRLKAFVHGEMSSTVFISNNNRERAEMFAMMGINVTTLPEEPVDQIIGMMLYCKFNAIMEGRMTVSQLDITSLLGDDVWYMHDEEDALGPFADPGWWHEPTVQHETIELDPVPDNVVKVKPSAWIEYGLIWPEETTIPTEDNTVVYGKFTKNEN